MEYDANDLPPPPPPLRRQDAVVLGNYATINGEQHLIQNIDGIEFVEISPGVLYNLKTDANGRYIIMNGVNTPIGGRRSKRRSRKSKRSRRV